LVYMYVSSGLSFIHPPLCSQPVAIVRVVLACVCTVVLVFQTLTLKLHLFFPKGANLTSYRGDTEPVFLDANSPFYLHHTISTSCEWILALLIFAYYLTIVEEFRKSSLTLPVITINPEYVLHIEKR
ncbi:hypothetical protein PENTCL1PPCAC_15423, partial [Pristionchus entomophagus]